MNHKDNVLSETSQWQMGQILNGSTNKITFMVCSDHIHGDRCRMAVTRSQRWGAGDREFLFNGQRNSALQGERSCGVNTVNTTVM